MTAKETQRKCCTVWRLKKQKRVKRKFLTNRNKAKQEKEKGVLKTKTPKTRKTPKTPKIENKDPPYFSELQNYDQPVANATES